MTKIQELKKEKFTKLKYLEFALDLNLGTFKIFDHENQLLAETLSNFKGKKVIPFVVIYYQSTQITLAEQSFEPVD